MRLSVRVMWSSCRRAADATSGRPRIHGTQIAAWGQWEGGRVRIWIGLWGFFGNGACSAAAPGGSVYYQDALLYADELYDGTIAFEGWDEERYGAVTRDASGHWTDPGLR